MRAYFLDRIRVILTILVIAHHSAITYGARGSWFVKLAPGDSAAALPLTFFTLVNQAFLAGFFFLIAGYLTPSSHDRKGWARYVRDRILRLGLPVLVFGFVIGPLTTAIAESRGRDFPARWFAMMERFTFVIGPMWFACVLLLFTLAYVLWRRLVAVKPGPKRPIPDHATWLLAALGVGLAALLIRQFVAIGDDMFGVPPGHFATYLFLFAVGCISERYGWLENVKRRHAMPWLAALAVAVLLLCAMPVAGASFGQLDGAAGFSLPAIAYAFWAPVVAWGTIAGTLWYVQLRWGERDRRWGFLSRHSYAAFILHPPVIVGLALSMQPLGLPAIAKFVLLTATGTAISFALAWLIRKVPPVRSVV